MGEKWARSSSGLICPSCPTDSLIGAPPRNDTPRLCCWKGGSGTDPSHVHGSCGWEGHPWARLLLRCAATDSATALARSWLSLAPQPDVLALVRQVARGTPSRCCCKGSTARSGGWAVTYDPRRAAGRRAPKAVRVDSTITDPVLKKLQPIRSISFHTAQRSMDIDMHERLHDCS
eukprot:COSAG04_NODE_660_length_11451_cov_7.123238_11_plen_175_part_00